MPNSNLEQQKQQVREFWNEQSCGTEVAAAKKFSREYFEEIESFRYFDQPFIHSFAQFPRYRGQRVLEVGFGAGTDFIQWLRCGARVSGVDLTPEALENVRHRIETYQLPQPEFLEVSDAERLPFDSDSFDLGYSFGVLHHTPDTPKAVAELVRVVRGGGEVKIMLYNRRSIFVINRWVKHALLRGRPWKSLAWVLWNYCESAGTKGYTRRELIRMLKALPLERIQVQTECTSGDYLSASALPPLNWIYRGCLKMAGPRFAWKPEHYASRINDPDRPGRLVESRAAQHPADKVLLTGNALGFFHCITARKRT
jgi:ubiquinone/menaquinone biosynthesis C-methylase UbiE